jgi:undecaprenyl-diphosphatase
VTATDPTTHGGGHDGAREGPFAHHLDRFAAFDARVDVLVDQFRSPALDHLMYALSSAADHSMLWHAAGALRSLRDRSIAPAKRMSKILGIESALTNGMLKSMFRRARPERDDPPAGELLYGMRIPITSSFPSGHATSAFVAAAVLSEDGSAPLWYGLAALVASSRVYVRMHHASDVIGGAAIGVALGAILRRTIR